MGFFEKFLGGSSQQEDTTEARRKAKEAEASLAETKARHAQAIERLKNLPHILEEDQKQREEEQGV